MIDMPVVKEKQKNWKPKWPKLKDPDLDIGKARKVMIGKEATVVSWGRTLPLVEEIAIKMQEKEGIEIDLIDLRTIYPYDWKMIHESIQNTGRVIFINEDTEVCNFAEHLLRRTCDELFYYLKTRPRIMAGKHIPGIGLSPILEESTQPQAWHIEEELRNFLSEKA